MPGFAQLFFRLTNNSLFNRLLIGSGMDSMMTEKFGMYKRVVPDKNLSAQEMAGFSTRQDVQEAINKAHEDVQAIARKHVKPGGAVLDIGCGAGAYLIHFEKDYKATGIDLNKAMIEKGRQLVPRAEFIYDDFLRHQFSEKFDYIYSISALEFIPPGKLDAFIGKMHSLLNKGGIIFLHYPHAVSKKSLSFPDLYYIEYAPTRIQAVASKYFDVISHQHAFDGRVIEDYDREPYSPGMRTFRNGYLLVAKKK
jgi:SAM-dependent methyltransferase